MTVPFHPRPNDPDAVHLNTLLDAMRSGTRAPDAASTESPEAAALADAADQFRGLVRRADAPAAAYLVDHPLQNRWEDIMSSAFPTAPPAAATGETFVPSAPVSNRTRRASAPPAGNRLNAWLSAAIVALMLLGTVGGAWWLGPGGSGPSDDGRTRLAAVTQDNATPEAIWPTPLTPEEAPWIAAISPDECIAEPMPYAEYAKAVTTDPGRIPDQSFEVVGPADPEVATDVVMTARGFEACMNAGLVPRARAYQTTENLFFNSGSTVDNAPYREELFDTRLEAGREWSAYLSTADPSDFTVLVSGFEPSGFWVGETWNVSRDILEGPNPAFDANLLYSEYRYDPDDALLLADGRIMIPPTRLLWAQDPMIQAYGVPDQSSVAGPAMVLENVDGEWRVDEWNIWVCVGACDNMLGTPAASPAATPQAASNAPLMDLLSAVPTEMPGMDALPLRSWTYADVERHLADMGITPAEAVADPLRTIGSVDFPLLARTTGIFSFSTDAEFVEAIGYNPLTVRQALGTDVIPESLIVLRGDWDEDALITAWETSGYTEYTTESGVTVWTIGPDGEIDPAHPIQNRMYQALNNVAILDGGILVYAGTMDTLEHALAVHSGEVASVRDDANLAPLLATVPENVVTLVAYQQSGAVLYNLDAITQNPNIRPEDMEELLAPFVESREAVGAMPDYQGVIIGTTSGSSDETPVSGETTSGEVFVRMGAGSEEDAAQMATVIEWRWQNFLSQRYQRPLNSVMTLTEATTDGTTVMLMFNAHGNPSIWLDLWASNDLMPFAVDREDTDASASPVATPES